MAQNNLGSYYLRGDGGPVDVDKALHWFKLSDAGGNKEADHNIESFYNSFVITRSLGPTTEIFFFILYCLPYINMILPKDFYSNLWANLYTNSS